RSEIKKVVPLVEEEFELFAQKVKPVFLKKNEIWEAEERIAQQIGFVNKGLLRTYYLKDSAEFIQQFHLEGDFMGNYLSYQNQSFSKTATAAIEDCELLQIPFAELERLAKQVPRIQAFSEYVGRQKLQQIHQRATSLLTQTPEERYQELLRNQPDLLQRLPQYYIAQYLGITPISLSRIHKRIFINKG
ncbi:MAG: Crp/Fnr family transcriptional regulator, partial [Bacteroidota bacterium]